MKQGVFAVLKGSVALMLVSILAACGGAPAGGSTGGGVDTGGGNATNDLRVLTFVANTPVSIGIVGAGGDTSARVVFKLTNGDGVPIAKETVAFSLSSKAGGLGFAGGAASGVTNAEGLVTAVVESGTVSTTVSVTAKFGKLEAVSSGLTISGGRAILRAMSLSFSEWNNSEAYTTDGVESDIAITVGDQYGNQVPKGTEIFFESRVYGVVGASCKVDGAGCSGKWTSGGTKPVDGRAWVLAYMEGSEEFVDLNANNVYDEGEKFFDVAEPCTDINRDGKCTGTEFYFDANGDGEWTDVNNTWDEYVHIGRSAFIVIVNPFANARLLRLGDNTWPAPGDTITLPAGGSVVLNNAFLASDQFITEGLEGSLPMAAGTKVQLKTTNGYINGETEIEKFYEVRGNEVIASLLGSVSLAPNSTDGVTSGVLTMTVIRPDETIAGIYTWLIVD